MRYFMLSFYVRYVLLLRWAAGLRSWSTLFELDILYASFFQANCTHRTYTVQRSIVGMRTCRQRSRKATS
jgi:hypothetical protein